MIRTLLRLVFNRWVLIALLLGCGAVVVWVVGPLVAIADVRPLETASSRWTAIGAMVGATVLLVAWKRWRARRGNARVVDQLIARPAPSAGGPEPSPDMLAVRERFEQALSMLRRARFGRGGGRLQGWSAKLGGRFLYDLPWYLIIGAPGSGKTTALQNCGLNFPLADAVGDKAVHGVGGTRHCDWWFTDQAVLIDTAGRFTTQDSDAANDRATWDDFLALLRRARPRQPLNGVIVTVSTADLLAGDAERARYAALVRKRVQELHERLAIRLPIYLLVTKSDLLAGFTDYFAPIDKDTRATPWGMTFALRDGTRPAAAFEPEFDALTQRLEDGLIERLQAERDLQRRARIYGFPTQFANLRGTLQEFLRAVFSPSLYEAEPMLRGVYFISGTQEGTPIDRVLGSIARSYRLERAVIPPQRASGKSYFLTRLLGEVVFAENGLAGTNLKWERRRGALVVGAYGAIGAVTALALSGWTLSWINNRHYVDGVAAHVDQVRQLVQATPDRASPDLAPVLPALVATRHLALADSDAAPGFRRLGLDQRPQLDNAARAAYDRMLVDAVLPRLGLRVEELLRLPGAPSDGQYEALKAYVMLHDPDHFEARALKSWIEADWDAQYGRTLDPDARASLSQHLDALLAQGRAVSPLPPDKALIDATRVRLASVTLPQRIYARLRQDGLGSEFPAFSVPSAGGSNAMNVFTLGAQRQPDKAVPGLYTYEAYHRGFQKQVASVAQQLASEQSWVMGISDPAKASPALLGASDPLLDDVRRLYLTEYAQTWEGFIADLHLQPMASLGQSIQMAQLLSAPDSPLPPLLKAISHQTTLLGGDKGLVGKVDAAATGIVDRGKAAIFALAQQQPPAAGPPVESIVDDRFTGLRRIVTATDGGKPPLDDTMAKIGQVQVLLVAVDTAIKGGTAPAPSLLPTEIKVEAARMPEPVRGMLENLSATSAHVSQTMVRENLSREVKSSVGEFCQQAVAGRYPLDRSAARDATQADFAQLFGPGGKIDALMQGKLGPYVDTTTRPWRFRPVEGTPLGTDAGTLPQFQRAQAIRETFFPNGAAPSMRLEFKPVDMDPSLTQFILDVDGQVVRYAHGPQIPTSVQWPGPRGSSEVHVQVAPLAGTSGMTFSGPWALFRLFDRVDVQQTNSPERFRATFDVDGRKAVFEVTTSSVRNPFRLRDLTEFSCPQGL